MRPPPTLRATILALAFLSRAGAAQDIRMFHAPGGALTGVIRDSASGAPIPYALIILVEGNRRVFAGQSGRFRLEALGDARATLRVQQIGFRPATVVLRIDASPGGAAGSLLEIRLVRQAFVLPELRVEGDACAGTMPPEEAEDSGSLAEVFKNADRLGTLQRAYPFRETYERLRSTYGADGELLRGRLDTVRYDSWTTDSYRPGDVIDQRPNREETAAYFQVSDLALEPFQRSHCFWYAGPDSLAAGPALRFQFAPLSRIRSVDWAGSLWIDAGSMVLVRSEAHLVNLPLRGTSFEWASCTMLYREILPTLVTQSQARCVTRGRGRQPRTTEARWVLIDHHFVGRQPDAAPPP